MKALSIKNLTKIYSNGFKALDGIDLTVNAGDFYSLLGPNGAGKTTAIAIVCSLVCLLYTSPSPRDRQKSRMPSSA